MTPRAGRRRRSQPAHTTGAALPAPLEDKP